MKDRTMNGVMRILSTPPGDAPIEIREKWIGIEMRFDSLDTPELLGSLFTKELVPTHNGFLVPEHIAIEKLAKKSPDAALWWMRRGFPREGRRFHFDARCAEIID